MVSDGFNVNLLLQSGLFTKERKQQRIRSASVADSISNSSLSAFFFFFPLQNMLEIISKRASDTCILSFTQPHCYFPTFFQEILQVINLTRT